MTRDCFHFAILDTAVKATVNGTPGFFVNDVALIGAQPASAVNK